MEHLKEKWFSYQGTRELFFIHTVKPLFISIFCLFKLLKKVVLPTRTSRYLIKNAHKRRVHGSKLSSHRLLECLADNPVPVGAGKGLDEVLLLQHPGAEDPLLLQLVAQRLQDAGHLLAKLGVHQRTRHFLPTEGRKKFKF